MYTCHSRMYVRFHLKFHELLHQQAAVASFTFQHIAAYFFDYLRTFVLGGKHTRFKHHHSHAAASSTSTFGVIAPYGVENFAFHVIQPVNFQHLFVSRTAV